MTMYDTNTSTGRVAAVTGSEGSRTGVRPVGGDLDGE